MTVTRKKLIEVALPLKAINEASAREKSIRHGHPSTLHLWWARRPLAAARAVIFAQMVDDPSSCPEEFPTEDEQERERQRLFRIIEELVKWENTTNDEVLQRARDEIWKSWRRACMDNADHPRAKELFNPEKLPAFHDPFAGGGSLPLEAQRLGLESYASDLNPVAVLINKAMIEIPPKFAGRPPVNPEARKEKRLMEREWRGAQGLAEDVRYYGRWMRDEAEKRIGHLYPKAEVTEEMARERPDLKPYVGKKLTVIAWLWARTVKSPNPAFAHVDVPLASTFMLSTKPGKEAYVEPVIEGDSYRFTVKVGKPKDPEAAKNGTKLSGANFRCLMSDIPISGDYIKAEGKAGRMGTRLMAIAAAGQRGRIYLSPPDAMEGMVKQDKPSWVPDVEISGSTQYIGVKPYGIEKFSQLFTNRQLMALTTLSDLVQDAREQVRKDAIDFGFSADGRESRRNDLSTSEYADALTMYLGMCVSRQANRSATLNFWDPLGENVQQVFARQALSMTWDYVEGNPFSESSGSFTGQVEYLTNALWSLPSCEEGQARQLDATRQDLSYGKVISTDPPYFDNVPYADLSDFFYIWLRRTLKPIFPDLFATLAVPKAEEIVAFAYRHENKEEAGAFFLERMGKAMQRLAEQVHPTFPVTIYYAFRQSKTEDDLGTASTGWETFLDAATRAGFGVSGTWPMRTEYTSNLKTKRNALASSIILVCRPRLGDYPTATRREFISALKAELPIALAHLQEGNIAPVDLAQAAIGPGMAVYTRYSRVLDAEGKPLSVRDALALINQTLDEVLAEQEGEFDAETRWALAWFESYAFDTGEFGVAETLTKAKNTSVETMSEAGILTSRAGKVRLFRPSELPQDWDPDSKKRLTVWETAHHLIRALEQHGEDGAAELVSRLGSRAESARDLAYRLYTICERRKWAKEALSYNSLAISWPEIIRLAREGEAVHPSQAQLL
ncbi:MAG: DUF1156 domain-containing protein [Sphingomonadaceae bacterium]